MAREATAKQTHCPMCREHRTIVTRLKPPADGQVCDKAECHEAADQRSREIDAELRDARNARRRERRANPPAAVMAGDPNGWAAAARLVTALHKRGR
jgi:hypothetical protein